jgi:hypothetical protein
LEQSHQARSTIKRYIEGKRAFIDEWLSKAGDDWDVPLMVISGRYSFGVFRHQPP